MGRQPWVIFGHLRTAEATSLLATGQVAATLAMYLLIYGALLAVFLFFAWRLIQKGPDLEAEPPYYQEAAS